MPAAAIGSAIQTPLYWAAPHHRLLLAPIFPAPEGPLLFLRLQLPSTLAHSIHAEPYTPHHSLLCALLLPLMPLHNPTSRKLHVAHGGVPCCRCCITAVRSAAAAAAF
jgi:hypothetical protein